MRYNKKAICIGTIKAVAFLLIFLILFQGATNLFRQKNMFYSISPIYDLPENSVDVLFLGSSHMYASVSPMDLWNDYGITSYNASVGLLSIPGAYFELRELLKVQKPKVLVLETFYIHSEVMVNDETRFHYIVDNIPFSFGISEAIQTLIPEEQSKTQYYLNFYTFHNRWKELSESDFRPWTAGTCSRYNRGANAAFYNHHSIIEPPAIVPRSETKMPPELPLEYLYKIIELCREEDIQPVFMAQPCSAGSDIQKMMNYVDVVAEKEGLPYINFFYLLDETGFDFAEDMADTGHVNYFGARKLTSYLGEYLQNNYQLEDQRGNPSIARLWNRDYEAFTGEINNIMMKAAENVDEYFSYLREKDYILAWNAHSETPLSETALPGLLERLEVNPSGVGGGMWYSAVTRGDQLLYGRPFEERPNDSYMVEDTLFSFGDGITGSTNRIGIHVGRKEYSVGDTGVNLVVYDPVMRMVVDYINIDLAAEDIKRE